MHGVDFKPDKGGEGWEAMRQYVSIRNKLAHPKEASDFEIDESKIEISDKAAQWFKIHILELLNDCANADANYSGRYR